MKIKLLAKSELVKSNYCIGYSKVINVLLVGRTQVGKTSLIASLLCPQYGGIKSGFSDTKLPQCYSFVIEDTSTKEVQSETTKPEAFNFSESNLDGLKLVSTKSALYQLNIIDTPGLSEVQKDGKEVMRSDEELMKLIINCAKLEVTGFNIICFVAKAGDAQLNDIKVFKTIKGYLNEEFSKISLMILSHADQCTEEAIKNFEYELTNHSQSQEIAKYCKLGFAPIGALDYLEFEAIKRQTVKEGLLEDKTERIIKMRDNLIKIFIEQAGQEKMLICDKLNSAVQTAEAAKSKAIENAIKEQQTKTGPCKIQ
jgi:predicted GTPase